MKVKEYISKSTARAMIFFGILSVYFGYSHGPNNSIPAEFKYGFGIVALGFGLTAFIQHGMKDSSGSEKE